MAINQERILAQLNVVAEIVKTNPDCKIYNVTRDVANLAKIARSLHKRYEASCSYEWATTDKYNRATDRLEDKAQSIGINLGVTIGLQRDPRGWPVIVKTGLYETRLG